MTAMPMTEALPQLPSVFSPLAKALLDGFSEGVVVFDVEGRLLYANHQARQALTTADQIELRVALGGRNALPDQALRASIFDRPPSSSDPAHGLDFADGAAVAGRTRAAIVADANRLGAWMGQ